MLRGLLIGAFFLTMTPLLISMQWLLNTLRLPGSGFISTRYYRVLCRFLRINIRMVGQPVRDRTALFVSNHVSWVDILVIGSILPVAFVAKREVSRWPLIGVTARVQRTVFVDRTRRRRTGEAIADMVDRLAGGVPVVLFAEGTSSDGNRVLPFRSALVGVVNDAAAHADFADKFTIQPMSIGYTGQHGVPMGRQYRPLVAWYGDLDFMPHFRDFVARGAVDAVVSYGEPLLASAATDRKTMAKSLETAVRILNAAALHGHYHSAPAAS